MRDTVRAPDFIRRRALSARLEQLFPARFVPRYSMVMFHPEIPYAEAQRRGALQEVVLDTLMAEGVAVTEDPGAFGRALDRAGL
jgi:kynurenine 3-monooxygenase